MPLAPDRLYLDSPGLNLYLAKAASEYALTIARDECPKLSGLGAANIRSFYGVGFFGLTFLDYIWYQNEGTKPQTMRWLAGKTIPMWIDDPTGEERRKNPKARTRTTVSGKTQILIFRKAANFGERKLVKRRVKGILVEKSVPKHYPGAPGRIAMRQAAAPFTTPGKIGGQIAKGNVGVWWYFPGLKPRGFLQYAINQSAHYFGIIGSMRIGYNFIDPIQERERFQQEQEQEKERSDS